MTDRKTTVSISRVWRIAYVIVPPNYLSPFIVKTKRYSTVGRQTCKSGLRKFSVLYCTWYCTVHFGRLLQYRTVENDVTI
jgi:hypothetical protein